MRRARGRREAFEQAAEGPRGGGGIFTGTPATPSPRFSLSFLRADRPGPVRGAAASAGAPRRDPGGGCARRAVLPRDAHPRGTCPHERGPAARAGLGVRRGAGECGCNCQPLSRPVRLDLAPLGAASCTAPVRGQLCVVLQHTQMKAAQASQ